MITTIRFPSIPGPRADLDRSSERRAGGNADRDAFDARDQARIVEGCLVADGDHFVDDAPVENRRHETCADALDLVRAGLAARKHRRVLRLDRNHLEVRIAALENLADTRDRAARADAGDHDVHVALGVVPDLLRGRAAVDIRVVRIFELLRDDRAGGRCDDLLRLGDRPFHALGGRGEHKVGAKQGQHLAPLDRHGLRA